MTTNLPPEAVEAAARAIAAREVGIVNGTAPGDTRDLARAALAAALPLLTVKPACATPGCPGDYRYASPGRGHLATCHYGRAGEHVAAVLPGRTEAQVAAQYLREAADHPALRLSGHSGISITRLRDLANRIERGEV